MPRLVLGRQHTFQIQIILTGMRVLWLELFQIVPVILDQNQAMCLCNSQMPLKILLSLKNYLTNLWICEVDLFRKTEIHIPDWKSSCCMSSEPHVLSLSQIHTVPQWNNLFLCLVYPHDNELRSHRESYKHQLRHDNPWLVNSAFEPIGFLGKPAPFVLIMCVVKLYKFGEGKLFTSDLLGWI